MLSCRDVTETASDYLERELGWWPRLRFKMHLAMCRHCRRYVKQIKATIGLLRAIPVDASASETEQFLLGRLRQSRIHPPAAGTPDGRPPGTSTTS